jgi:hypothetical protein
VSMGTRRSVVALWIALFAGSILAFMTRGAGPLPGDLALTRWLQEWLPPDGLVGSVIAYAGRLVWFLPIAFLAVMLLGWRWFGALSVLVAAVSGLLLGDALKLLVARAPVGRAGAGLRAVGRLRLPEHHRSSCRRPSGCGLLPGLAGTAATPSSSRLALRFFVVGAGERHLARSCRGALGDGRLGRLALRKRLVANPDIHPSPGVLKAGTAADASVRR